MALQHPACTKDQMHATVGIPWRKWYRARPRHVAWFFRKGLQAAVGAYFGQCARRRIRGEFPGSDFVGPYEKGGVYNGIWEDQWLWDHRDLIRGVVLDMSTPRYFHEYIYELPTVEKVLISDLCAEETEKYDHKSKVDIVGDFCASHPACSPESFDTVLCLSILEHCEDPSAMVKNIRVILRPGGVAFFWSPFAYVDGHMKPDYWRFCRDGYLLLARRGGLEVLETGQFDDLGKYFIFKFGWNGAATSWHRGVPVVNWMICRKRN